MVALRFDFVVVSARGGYHTAMPYGHLTSDMLAALRPIVSSRSVADLGCGDGHLAEALRKLGPTRLVTVDKKVVAYRRPDVLGYFHEAHVLRSLADLSPDVAFVSWPINSATPALIDILVPTPVVVYLGRNSGGIVCGWPDFFRAMLRRRVLVECRAAANDLIVYGESLPMGSPRRPVRDEIGGLDWSKSYHLDELTGLADRSDA